MCGRYTQTKSPDEIVSRFAVDLAVFRWENPRYNVAPTQTVPIVRNADGNRELIGSRWGLVPSWAKDTKIGNRMINARAETVADKPAYRFAFRKRRCLIPADGYYEWRKDPDGGKTPMYIRLKRGGLFAFAGLWESWTDTHTGETLTTFTILTTEPNAVMRPIHNRMPLILRPDEESAWLDPANDGDPARLRDMLRPYDDDAMEARQVSSRVNSPRNDDPACVEPMES